MNTIKRCFLSIFAAVLMFSLIACEKEGPMEKAGKKADQAIEETGKKADQTVEKAGEAVEEAADAVKKKTE